jgi:hypothetical protein
MIEKSYVGWGVVATSLLVACGSVGGADPELWRPAPGLVTVEAGGEGGAGHSGSGGYGGSAGSAGSSNGGIQGQGGITVNTGGWQTSGTGGGFGSGGFFDGTGGSNAGTGGSIGGTGGSNSGTCTFRFDVTTTSYGGRFRPRNVGAIYITSSTGAFVKTLNVWGTVELRMLTDWNQLSGGNTVDAVTGATRANAGPISGSWDCTDVSHQAVPDGEYQACCSFQEDDALPFFGPAPKKACVSFTKGAPFTLSPPDQGNFTNMTLVMQ